MNNVKNDRSNYLVRHTFARFKPFAYHSEPSHVTFGINEMSNGTTTTCCDFGDCSIVTIYYGECRPTEVICNLLGHTNPILYSEFEQIAREDLEIGERIYSLDKIKTVLKLAKNGQFPDVEYYRSIKAVHHLKRKTLVEYKKSYGSRRIATNDSHLIQYHDASNCYNIMPEEFVAVLNGAKSITTLHNRFINSAQTL